VPSLPQSTHNGSLAAQATGSSIPSVHLHCPHCHCACLGKLVPMLSQGHPTVCLSWSVTYRPFGAQAVAPTGRAISYSHPPPASGLSGLSRWSWPWSRRCRRRRASLPCVRSSAAYAAPFLSPVAHARRRRNPAAGRWTLPAASHPRLRFGHPARPPKALHRFSFLCAFAGLCALLVVSLCLAAVGFASAFADAFAFESVGCSLGCALNSCQDCASGSSWDSCHDWATEMLTASKQQIRTRKLGTLLQKKERRSMF